MRFTNSGRQRYWRNSAPRAGAASIHSGRSLVSLGLITAIVSTACDARTTHETRNHASLGLMTSTWSLDARSRAVAPHWALTSIAQYRTPEWRFRLAAPYYLGSSPRGRDLSGFGRVIVGADYYRRLSRFIVLTPYVRALIDTGSLPRRITGGNAAEPGIGATFTFASRWSATLRAGYRFQQSLSTRSRASFPTWELAAGYGASARDAFQLALVNMPTRFVGFQDARYLALGWNHVLRPEWTMQFYATAGLTPTSPDYGVGVGGMFRLH